VTTAEPDRERWDAHATARNRALHAGQGPMNLMSFDEALKRGTGRRHVLLGNGFSRALKDDIFAYDALFERADFSALSPSARKAFDVLCTTDFEVVMRALRDSASLASLYVAKDPDAAKSMRRDADGLRDLLAETIATNHPDRPYDISDEAYKACRLFLARFDGHIFSLNYDLLLYWALMQTELAPPMLESDDGFRQPEEGPADYVVWDPSDAFKQNIFYLHGALHLFDAGATLRKMTYSNTGEALVDQIRRALDKGFFPAIVTEGTSVEKVTKIMHSAYLGRGFRSFGQIGGTLFTFGFAMSGNDQHWLMMIAKSKVGLLAVGLYGDPESDANAAIRQRAEALRAARRGRNALDVVFYDAKSAAVWG
jgi:hypothetical protein